MKIRKTKKVVSVVISFIVLTNATFVYADDIKFVNRHTLNIVSKNIENDKVENINNNNNRKPKINVINNRYFVYYDDRNKYAIVETEEEDDDTNKDYILNMLNLSYNEYKNELKRGESLQSLLEKNNATTKYNSKKYDDYISILQNAVDNNAISKDEMDKLLSDYIKNIETLSV